MSLFTTPEEHAANGPETWQVVKIADGFWAIAQAGTDPVKNAGDRIDTFGTKAKATAALTEGHAFDLWHKESRWYAGEPVMHWKPWAEVKAERERTEKRNAERTQSKATHEQEETAMTTLTIHYQSPKADPLKVPRPHRIDMDTDEVTGGEIGPVSSLIGFTKDRDPNFHDVKRWVTQDQVKEAVEAGELKGEGFKGWRACFSDDSMPFTNLAKIERVEVSA